MNKSKNATRFALVLPVILCVALAIAPSIAYGLEVTHTYQPGQEVPQTVTEDGKQLNLADKKYIDLPDVSDSKSVTETRTRTIAASDWNGNAASYFSAEIEASQADGYTGMLKLQQATSANGSVATNDKRVTFEDFHSALTQEEINAIPYTVSSDVPGYGTQSFTRESIDAWPTGDGTNRQSVNVTYATTVSDSHVSNYVLTATYSGNVSRTVDGGQSVTVTYNDTAPQVAVFDTTPVESSASSASSEETAKEQQPAQQDTVAAGQTALALLGLVLIVAAAVVGTVFFVRGYKKRNQTPSCEVVPDEESPVTEADQPDDGEDEDSSCEDEVDEDALEEREAEEKETPPWDEDAEETSDEPLEDTAELEVENSDDNSF